MWKPSEDLSWYDDARGGWVMENVKAVLALVRYDGTVIERGLAAPAYLPSAATKPLDPPRSE